MDAISLKQFIFENKKIEFILDNIGCKDIVYHPNKEFYSCSNYNGDNKSAVNVKNNAYLNVINWTRMNEFDDNADIITLVEYNKQLSFNKAIKYLHSILGLEYKYQEVLHKKYEDPLYVFKKHKTKEYIDVSEINPLDENIMDDYVPLLHISWFREGIMEWTRKKFGLAYSYKRKRIIIPLRDWRTGRLLGINARTTVEDYKELGISKYYITPSYQKSKNIFGLWEHEDDIKKAGYVVVYESEKSVMKRDSLGDCTGVAISGHSLSNEQISILNGLNVDIIISMDKDVDIQEIRHMCSRLYRSRTVYYTYDKWDLLDNKESIADKSPKIFDFLMKYKVHYDDTEQSLYEKGLKNKK